jgi:basic membrane protein A
VENAWNSRIHLAMQEAAEAGLIEYEFSEGVAATDYPRAMREYAESGAQLIWGESYAVEREAREVAADYPETAFLMGSSGGPEGDNFGVFGTRNHEAAYLAGMLAGTMSESNVFGSVGGYPIPEVNLLINAFRMGVSEVNPDATFLNGFIGAWFDPARAQEMAIAQIDQGADILFGERIGTADGAQARGVKAIGIADRLHPALSRDGLRQRDLELRAHHRGHRRRRAGGQPRGPRLHRVFVHGLWRQRADLRARDGARPRRSRRWRPSRP